MIKAEEFIEIARKRGFGLYTGVPCSFLTPFINCVIDSPNIRYIGAANEGDAVAIAAGAEIGGLRSVAMFQNSGLGNAVNPLTSLHQIFHIPILLIVTWRGEPEGVPDEPQHALMGAITTRILDLMEIPWTFFPEDAEQIERTLDEALSSMRTTQKPYALVMRKGSVEPVSLNSTLPTKPSIIQRQSSSEEPVIALTRRDALQVIKSASNATDIIVATTGYTGRELYALEDVDRQFYMVGSMGCISSLGLGIAVAQSAKRVIVIDGDGSLLMRMGALSVIGYERPKNYLHILLDNNCHESTGGQSTVSHSIDFCKIASACGYEKVVRSSSEEEIKKVISDSAKQLTFLHIKTKVGIPEKLPRPSVSPVEQVIRIRQFIGQA